MLTQSRNRKSRDGARNQFQEPSLAKLHRLAGRYDNPMPTWFLALSGYLHFLTKIAHLHACDREEIISEFRETIGEDASLSYILEDKNFK
jgi:hypothetical protein